MNLSSPSVAYDIKNGGAATYVHFLFALRERGLRRIDTGFASSLYSAFIYLEKNWEVFVADVRNGSINPSVDVTVEIRQQLLKHLQPLPERADELQREFEQGMDGIARRIWSNLTMLCAVTTGPMQVYMSLLDNKHTRGITIFSGWYSSSEGHLGVNLWPKYPLAHYVLVPSLQFYEFIPLDDTDVPRVLTSREVQVGGVYVLLISTPCGLYRYNTGDVIKIVRFHHQAPVLEFLYREKFIMDVGDAKIPEDLMYKSICTALKELHVSLVDYTCAVNSMLVHAGELEATAAPFYVLFLELNLEASPEEVGLKIDHYLKAASPPYTNSRESNRLGCVRVYLVRSGAFQEMQEYLVKEQKASPYQFKMLRCI
jgi:hypothetical protein